ncbi:MAG: short-chain dehydrogenase/reductase [Devosia sp.]|uniref:oxidoreductase n=1 Tax=Devosia sp. TaxID=1871048 RepID=UPI00262124C3|nr:oxidoreductase [Devosia sp.]MDB5528912.1 short-chain dehydrogenase/reductase [Devosia sp.]
MSTLQAPIGSGFGAATTAQEIVAGTDLSGKIAIVTGGYAGMGLEITKALTAAGATVIVPARDREKAQLSLGTVPGAELESLDLMDAASIDGFASRFLSSNRPLHILINNAGIMYPPLQRDARGNESQFSTNHLGHFQLTARLWPALQRANGARVVSVSSIGHHHASVDFDDPNFLTRAYDRGIAYGQSKTANALFAVGLDARGAAHGVRAFAVHPGGVITDLVRYISPADLLASGYVDAQGKAIIDPARNMKTAAQGAATSVWCATSSQLDFMGGVYCEDCDLAVATAADSTTLLGVRPWAIDPALADRLWTLSESLTGAAFL